MNTDQTQMEETMKTNNRKSSFRAWRGISVVTLGIAIAAGTPLLPRASAQCSFSSGSTGADGPFNPPTYVPAGTTISNNVVTVPLPPNGIFNFTSIYIETNWVVKFARNTLNTPVYLLATTNVTIKGTIDVSGSAPVAPWLNGGAGGPGGFDGGNSTGVDIGAQGHGPGAGYPNDGHAGHAFPCCNCSGALGQGASYGVIDILPMIGGSGGAGDWRVGSDEAGGGGGGALLIASSGTISCSGGIWAIGGCSPWSGDGSGGSVRLIAVVIEGEGQIRAHSGRNCASAGRIRLEACAIRRTTLTTPPATFGPPGVVFLNPNPTIKIVSIAGANTPWPPAGLLTMPDVYLPTNFVNPASITALASNINPGTAFKVIITPAYGTNLVATGTLSGSYAASTGSVNINVYTDRVWRVNALIDYIPRP